jgi:formate hydrogenlyase subunit 6/NADH:ubiquinone oxidoreductase subunit I
LKTVYPARFLVARSTRIPLLGKAIGRFFFEGDDMVYLPRDGAIAAAQPPAAPDSSAIKVQAAIDPPEEIVLPSQVVEHFVQQASVHWIMDRCLCRQSEGCDDYPVDLGCLFLGQAAEGINPRLGQRVTPEQALAHVRHCRELGLVHLIGRNKLDTMWLGVGPGHQLLTICNCCPCCCLFGVLPHLDEPLQERITRMPGVTVKVTERCVGCGACTRDVCFVNAITMADGEQAEIGQGCVGCGRCVSVCPQQAIELSVDDGDFVQATIERISPSIDVT